MRKIVLTAVLLLCAAQLQAGWRYTNPIIHMDFSDPDVCRVGDDFYMTASSFNFLPGLPVLHSRDLVNWKIIGTALPRYGGRSEDIGHGKQVWAPSIRWHEGWFYIFVGDPDRGIFMVRSKDPAGTWEKPVWLTTEKGFIDPCPLWDDDGRAYLSHALAGSRAGLKSVILVAPMAPDGTSLLGPSRIVYDGHATQPTIEGTKFYKREGRYYIFCPAGGVSTGWQSVLRSESPMGPWEEKIVLAWAPGTINGPHQGAWVDVPGGGDWFIHFQDKGAYGRIVHLQPMVWTADGWPVIGEDPDGDGTGAPVSSWEAPLPLTKPQESGVPAADAGPYGLSLEWQYPTVPSPLWHYALPDGGVRLFSQVCGKRDLRERQNMLGQKFPAERFTVTARLTFAPNPQLAEKGEEAGFTVIGNSYAGLRLTDTLDCARLEFVCSASEGGERSTTLALLPWTKVQRCFPYSSGNVPAVRYPDSRTVTIWVRLEVRPKAVEGNVPDAMCQFLWSPDGRAWEKAGERFKALPQLWTGARFAFYCNRKSAKNDSGWLDVTLLEVKPEFASLFLN